MNWRRLARHLSAVFAVHRPSAVALLASAVAASLFGIGPASAGNTVTVPTVTPPVGLATPWNGSAQSPGLAQYFQSQTLASITGLDGQKAVNYNNSGLGLVATLQNVTGTVNLASAPGYSTSALGGFTVEGPLSGGWSISVTGTAQVEATACCTPVHQNWFGIKGSVPFSLMVSNLQLDASANLATLDAQHLAAVSAHASISGSGFLGSTPIQLTPSVANGVLTLTGQIVNVGLTGGVGSPELSGTFSITFEPAPTNGELEAGDTVGGGISQKVIISLQGQASVSLPQPIGKKGVGVAFSFPAYLPSFPELVRAAGTPHP